MGRVYTTPTCPWCGKVKEYLQAKGVQYSEIDVAADASGARRLVELTGQRSVEYPRLRADAPFRGSYKVAGTRGKGRFIIKLDVCKIVPAWYDDHVGSR